MENLDAVSKLTESSQVGDEAIEAIRGRRAKITDYAVAASKQPLFGHVTECTVGNYPVFAAPDSPPVAYVADMEDAKFYAHAPTDIDTLLERLADNEQMLQRQIESFNLEWAKRREVEQECERLRAQLVESERKYHLVLSQIWEALGVSEYNGKHVVEHVSELRARLAEVEAERDSAVEAQMDSHDAQMNAEQSLLTARAAAFNDAIEKERELLTAQFKGFTNAGELVEKNIAELTALRDEQPKGGS